MCAWNGYCIRNLRDEPYIFFTRMKVLFLPESKSTHVSTPNKIFLYHVNLGHHLKLGLRYFPVCVWILEKQMKVDRSRFCTIFSSWFFSAFPGDFLILIFTYYTKAVVELPSERFYRPMSHERPRHSSSG